MSNALSAEFISTLAGRRWKSSKRADGQVGGLHKSRHQGHSLEFIQHRQYVSGDEIKRIDWKLFARNEKFFVKQYEAETNLRAYIMLDASGSMNYPPGGKTKFAYASRIAAAAAYVFTAQNDSVGLCLARKDSPKFITPKNGWSHFEEIEKALGAADPKGPAGIASCVENLAEKMKKRSVVVLISDLMENRDSIFAAIKRLGRRRHECFVIQILDRNELAPAFSPGDEIKDSETGAAVEAHENSVRDYTERMAEELAFYKTTFRKHSVPYYLFFTDAPAETNFARLLD